MTAPSSTSQHEKPPACTAAGKEATGGMGAGSRALLLLVSPHLRRRRRDEHVPAPRERVDGAAGREVGAHVEGVHVARLAARLAARAAEGRRLRPLLLLLVVLRVWLARLPAHLGLRWEGREAVDPATDHFLVLAGLTLSIFSRAAACAARRCCDTCARPGDDHSVMRSLLCSGGVTIRLEACHASPTLATDLSDGNEASVEAHVPAVYDRRHDERARSGPLPAAASSAAAHPGPHGRRHELACRDGSLRLRDGSHFLVADSGDLGELVQVARVVETYSGALLFDDSNGIKGSAKVAELQWHNSRKEDAGSPTQEGMSSIYGSEVQRSARKPSNTSLPSPHVKRRASRLCVKEPRVRKLEKDGQNFFSCGDDASLLAAGVGQ